MLIEIKTKEFNLLEAKEDIICFKFTTKFCSEFKFEEECANRLFYKTNKARKLKILSESGKVANKEITSIYQGFVSFLNYKYFFDKYNEVYLFSCLKKDKSNLFEKIKSFFFDNDHELLCQEEIVKIGKFKIPKGSLYCITKTGKIISNNIIYTGKFDVLTANPIIDNRIISDKTFALRLVSFINNTIANDCASIEEKIYLLNMAKNLLKYQIVTAKEQSELSYINLNKDNINRFILLE